MKRSELQVNLYVRYLFNASGKLRPYLKAGVFENIVISGDNDVYDAYNGSSTGLSHGLPFTGNDKNTKTLLEMNNIDVSFSLAAGAKVGRHQLEFIGTIPPGNISSTDIPFRTGSYRLCYFFSLIK